MTKRPIDENLVSQARALGDPTRHRIFRYIADAGRPVAVAELTSYVKLNHNAVRQHLAVLCQAGLVGEEIEVRDRPGRPRLLYRLDPRAAGNWGITGPMELLASALAQAISTGQSPYQVGTSIGLQQGTQLNPAAETPSPAELIQAEMLQRGFQPTLRQKGTRVEYSLHHCPFSTIAEQNPEVVCQLHQGLMDGLTQALGQPLEVTDFVPRKNSRQTCRVIAQVS